MVMIDVVCLSRSRVSVLIGPPIRQSRSAHDTPDYCSLYGYGLLSPLGAPMRHGILDASYPFTKINYSGGPLFVVKEIDNYSDCLVGCERIVNAKFEIAFFVVCVSFCERVQLVE